MPVDYDPDFSFTDLPTGLCMAHIEFGPADGPPILLIHGVTDSYLSFSQVAPRLAAAGHRAVVPELRGHGHTDKPKAGPYTVAHHAADLEALMERLGLRNAHVVGHSLGSLIAQALAVRRPDLVVSLTLIASSGRVAGNQALTWALEGDGDFPGINHLTELPEAFLRDWTGSSNHDPAFVEKTYEHARRMPLYAWVNAFNGIANDPDRLAEITVPVQIIYGAGDTFFTLDEQLELIRRLGSTYILYQPKPGHGHNVHWEDHMDEEVAGDILGFLRAGRREG